MKKGCLIGLGVVGVGLLVVCGGTLTLLNPSVDGVDAALAQFEEAGYPREVADIFQEPEGGPGAVQTLLSAAPGADLADVGLEASGFVDDFVVLRGGEPIDFEQNVAVKEAVKALSQRASTTDDPDRAVGDLQAASRLIEFGSEPLLIHGLVQAALERMVIAGAYEAGKNHPEIHAELIQIVQDLEPLDLRRALAGETIWMHSGEYPDPTLPEFTMGIQTAAAERTIIWAAEFIDAWEDRTAREALLTDWETGAVWYRPDTLYASTLVGTWRSLPDLELESQAQRRLTLLSLGADVPDIDPFSGQPFGQSDQGRVSAGPDGTVGTDDDVVMLPMSPVEGAPAFDSPLGAPPPAFGEPPGF